MINFESFLMCWVCKAPLPLIWHSSLTKRVDLIWCGYVKPCISTVWKTRLFYTSKKKKWWLHIHCIFQTALRFILKFTLCFREPAPKKQTPVFLDSDEDDDIIQNTPSDTGRSQSPESDIWGKKSQSTASDIFGNSQASTKSMYLFLITTIMECCFLRELILITYSLSIVKCLLFFG